MGWSRIVFSPFRAIVWQAVKALVRQKFPLPTLSTATLADWLSNDPSSFILIDTRKKAEYNVSHLPHAHHAETVAESEAVMAAVNLCKRSPIVLYCSVGYRSGRLGVKLQEAGYSVMNLEGSIFQWANEGRSLVTADHSTRQVHPYSDLWGLLLTSRE